MCAQVLSQWMPADEEPQGRAAWGRRRTPQAAASVLLLIDSHPLVLNHMVRTSPDLLLCFSVRFISHQPGVIPPHVRPWTAGTHCTLNCRNN